MVVSDVIVFEFQMLIQKGARIATQIQLFLCLKVKTDSSGVEGIDILGAFREIPETGALHPSY